MYKAQSILTVRTSKAWTQCWGRAAKATAYGAGRVPAAPLSHPAPCLQPGKAEERGPRSWAHAHMWKIWKKFLVQISPAPAVEAICGVNQQMGMDALCCCCRCCCSMSLSPSLSFKQVNQGGGRKERIKEEWVGNPWNPNKTGVSSMWNRSDVTSLIQTY